MGAMESVKPQPPIQPQFGPGELVSHITDENARGVIVAFMARRADHLYQVQWGVEKCEWHLDFEIKRLPEPTRPIGFWRATP